jgi:hypothetical protein
MLVEYVGSACQSLITLHLGLLTHNMYLANISFLGGATLHFWQVLFVTYLRSSRVVDEI